jgi:phosphonate transport system substrate-binding protein
LQDARARERVESGMNITMARRLLLIMICCIVTLIINGCERKQQASEVKAPLGQHELLIGLIPEQNVFRQRERYQALRKYLSDRLGIAINFTSLSRYGNIIERFTSERMDGAFFGSFTYALAHSQLGVEPIARPVNLDGTSTYHGYIFVRKDSGIRSVTQMKGKRFVFVERATTAGYVFPLAYFRENGVKNPHAFLGETFFAGSHDAAIKAVLNKEADIGAAKNTMYDQLSTENPRVQKELVVLATSGVVPQNCLAVRKDLEPELKKMLRKALIEMEKDPDGKEALRCFGARGFIETNNRDYDYLYNLSSEVGIDLKTYRYNNE